MNVITITPDHENELLRLCHRLADLSLNVRQNGDEIQRLAARVQHLSCNSQQA